MHTDKELAFRTKKISKLIWDYALPGIVGTVVTALYNVIDRAIQLHGGAGLSQDSFLAQAYAGARSLRLADGPDEVHIAALARSMLKG